jgi:hypothetical protein
MTTDKTRLAVNAIQDHRAAQDTLGELNRVLIAAGTTCRALVHDANALGDADMKKAARRLLRIVNRMTDGPNKAVWADLSIIETAANGAFNRFN